MSGSLEDGLIRTADLMNKKVWMGRPKKDDPEAMKKMGRVHACVFHPKSKRCVGLLVKRPDVALMFRRQDLFVAFDGFEAVDKNLAIRNFPEATGSAACKAAGIKLDDCVIWHGLAVMCEDGTAFGTVGDVLCVPETGTVEKLVVSKGAAANTLLGTLVIPASEIRGFKRGMGTQLYVSDDDDQSALGCIIVSDAVKDMEVEGGVAETAGAATAVAVDKASKAVEKAKPTVKKATAAAGEAVNKGAYVTGRQIGRTKGMFSSFKDEFKKALKDEETK